VDIFASSSILNDVPAMGDVARPAPVLDVGPTHQYGTRLKNNIRQPKQRTDGTITYYVVRSSIFEPTSHVVALKILSGAKQWMMNFVLY
jgi:hypothetical protein